jgi:hypothetical protein
VNPEEDNAPRDEESDDDLDEEHNSETILLIKIYKYF